MRFTSLHDAWASYLEKVVNRHGDATALEAIDSAIDFYAGAQVALEILGAHIERDPDIYSKLMLEIQAYHDSMRSFANRGRAAN